ncbi:MAG: GNAT family N-acetyltransferase [Candidatus Omnitrophica bacterium]|nr:GNAT family N-acetyltransferase [Candidatus Omnitrophota bacterium]
MEVILKQEWKDINPHEWDDLLLKSPTQTVFQLFGWHQSWWEHFSIGKQLFLIQVFEDKKLIGLAPLYRITKGPWRILKFIGSGHSDYCDFLYPLDNPAVLSAILKWLALHQQWWDVLVFDYIPERSMSMALMNEAFKDSGLGLRKYSEIQCPAVLFDRAIAGELIDKQSLRRHAKHFQVLEGYKVLHLNAWEDIEPWLEQFFGQHIERWHHSSHKSLFIKSENVAFYRSFIKCLCAKGNVVFSVIQSQGQPIAFHIGLLFGKDFIWYKPSFDISLSRYSPGEVLLRELFIYACSQGISKFDFSIGDEPFKRRFANAYEKNVSFKVFKSRGLGLLDALLMIRHRI